MLCLITQSCLTLCDPMDSSPPVSCVHGDSTGKNTRVGCHTLLQGIFPTQGIEPTSLMSPALAGVFLIVNKLLPGKPTIRQEPNLVLIRKDSKGNRWRWFHSLGAPRRWDLYIIQLWTTHTYAMSET